MELSRVGSVWRRIARKPPRQLAQRAVQLLSQRVDADALEFPLYEEDIADSGAIRDVVERSSPRDEERRLAWITVPPGVGSGGHTTLFRMIQAAREAGFDNTLLLYDRYNGDYRVHLDRIRRGWPWLDCDIRMIPERVHGYDGTVASSWPTAHVAATRVDDGARLYFIQDFEPYFHPRGSLYALAEDTYRFGFRNIALGPMISSTIQREVGTHSDTIPFGTDRSTYRLLDADGPRAGIAFFAKRNNDRRGYRIAVLALREFRRRMPDQPIHVYGDRLLVSGLDVVNHGYLAPDELNHLYNRVIAGLILSFTNISLVPAEMAAAGAVPVLNQDADARLTFGNPEARWAEPTPSGLAGALVDVVRHSGVSNRARATAAWHGPTWADTANALVGILRDELPTR